MVAIDEIRDEETLTAWLKALPQEAEARRIAVTIAFRAAARVLPMWWAFCLTDERARKGDLTALPILRSLLISSVADKMPTDDIRSAAANAAANAAAIAANAAAYAAAYAAIAAANAANAAAYAAIAAANAAYAAIAWDGVRGDLRVLIAGEDAFARRLWPEGGPLEGEWLEAREALEAAGRTEAWG